jgi:hypothetical protein
VLRDSHTVQVFVEEGGFLWTKRRITVVRRQRSRYARVRGWGPMISIIVGAIFVAGTLIGGCVAWFIRSVIADVRREDAAIDRRVLAQQQLNETGRA